jgi:hypothetical protein
VEIEFHDLHFARLAAIFESAVREDQKNQRQEQQNAACGRELLEYRPEKFLDDVQASAVSRQPFRRLCLDVARVQPVTGAGFGLELRPELADFEALGDAPPEIVQPRAERDTFHGRLSGRWKSGCHGDQDDYRGLSNSRFGNW